MRKKNSKTDTPLSSDVASIILAGGQGNRLYPLTTYRCKPAVTFGGRYRIIDVAISNSINSGIPNIYILSQFLASTLNNYILEAYPAEALHGGHIEILSPEETPEKKDWYQGTADAVRQNLTHLLKNPAKYFVVLSGDQLYNMNLKEMVAFAKQKDADLTIATIKVPKEDAKRMGVMKIDSACNIVDFVEKPTDEKLLETFKIPHRTTKSDVDALERDYLGSMGIYVFKREALVRLLEEDAREDFGKHLIPTQLAKGATAAYIFQGYWEDIGTIASFYEANLKIARNQLCLDLYNERNPIYAQSVNLPSARLHNTRVSNSIICDGSVIEADHIENSTIGVRSLVEKGTRIFDSIIMGNQTYSPIEENEPEMKRVFRIGKNCTIKKAIIDEHCSIGNNVHLTNEKGVKHYDGNGIFIRDGIIVVTSGTHLPDNFTL